MARNETVDIIRGFAMLLVVLGHTMSGSTIEYQNSFLFQVIKIIIDIISTTFWTIWLFLIVRYDFYSGNDSGLFILFRFFASIVGGIAIISLLVGINNQKVKIFHWSGVHSLEIYLTHYLFLNMIKVKIPSSLMVLNGIIMLVINFVFTIIIRLKQSNNIMNYLLYGKRVRHGV